MRLGGAQRTRPRAVSRTGARPAQCARGSRPCDSSYVMIGMQSSPDAKCLILTLDVAGVRGMFTLQILQRMGELLRAKPGNPQLVLADHFDFIAGTSTGAIIAAFLSWGESIE